MSPDPVSSASASARPGARRGRPRSGGREAILGAALDLLRERGASRLTTREVASRAGVSEGSLFYHFTDRTGLLTAVIEDALGALALGYPDGSSAPAATFEQFAAGLAQFLDRALIVLVAAQSDSELRTGMADFMRRNNFGPHRGVESLAAYLRSQQAQGTIRDDVDPEAVAMMLLGPVFMQVSQRQMISAEYGDAMPGPDRIVASLITMLAPPGPGQPAEPAG